MPSEITLTCSRCNAVIKKNEEGLYLMSQIVIRKSDYMKVEEINVNGMLVKRPESYNLMGDFCLECWPVVDKAIEVFIKTCEEKPNVEQRSNSGN